MYYDNDLSHVRPNHVNEEALVFRGCTNSEISLIAGASVVFWAVVMTLIGLPFDMAIIMFSLSLLMSVITIFIVATALQHVKRGRPPGHYQHLISLLLARCRMKKCPYMLHDGQFSLGRTKQHILLHTHLGSMLSDNKS